MTAAQTLLADPSTAARRHPDRASRRTRRSGSGTKYFDIAKFGAAVRLHRGRRHAGRAEQRDLQRQPGRSSPCTAATSIPGSAKGIMVNSIRAMADIIVRLPRDIAPETTEGYEPYIHPHVLEGEEARSTLKMLLRDFDTPGLEVLKKQARGRSSREVQPLHPKATDRTEDHRAVPEHEGLHGEGPPPCWTACGRRRKRAGLEPRWVPIRGGTDGSRLTETRAAHAEHLHRGAELPRPDRVAVGRGHEQVGRDRRPPRPASGWKNS